VDARGDGVWRKVLGRAPPNVVTAKRAVAAKENGREDLRAS
jgi:hypothetical protein